MTIYSTALGKGGSTKTTTAAEITAHLAARGRRVLAVDMDEQGTSLPASESWPTCP